MHQFLRQADLILGIGCTFTETRFGDPMPKGKKFIHATIDPDHLEQGRAGALGLVGDAR